MVSEKIEEYDQKNQVAQHKKVPALPAFKEGWLFFRFQVLVLFCHQ